MEQIPMLPPQVTDRLSDTDQIAIRARGGWQELRKRPFEIRETESGLLEFKGYATVYDHPYDVAGGAPVGWTETIASGAATKSINEKADVRFLINHDGLPLARTRSKTMTLESDDIGLLVRAELDPSNPRVQEVRSAMQRGDLDEMSFGFQAVKQEWNEDYTERSITEVRLFDVSIVTYPANPATVATLRNGEQEMEINISGGLVDSRELAAYIEEELLSNKSDKGAMSLSLAQAQAEALRIRKSA